MRENVVEFLITRDPWSFPRPILCVSVVDGEGGIYAEGAAISLTTAIARCRSETIERKFQLAQIHPMLGIAAHPLEIEALRNAKFEAIESLVIEQLSSKGILQGYRFAFSRFIILAQRVEEGWFTLISDARSSVEIAAQSVRPTLLGSLIKTYTELRSLLLRPQSVGITKPTTKAGRLGLRASHVRTIRPATTFTPKLPSPMVARKEDHYLAYYLKENS